MGDLPWQAKTWRQTRHFECKACCPYCTITREDIAKLGSEDEPPAWHGVPGPLVWLPNPRPAIATIPGLQRPLYRHDVFHLGHLGIARRFYTSVLVVFCWLGLFNKCGYGNSLDCKLERAYAHFAAWCRGQHATPLVKEFTRSNIGHPVASKFPDCSWKASDSELLMKWVQDFLDEPIQYDDDGVLAVISAASVAYNNFFSLIWSSHDRQWLTRAQARVAFTCLWRFIRSYVLLAQWAYGQRFCLSFGCT